MQKWTQGIDGFEKAFHTDLLNRGNAAYERGDYDTAIKLFQESVDHGHPTAHQLIGYAKQAKAEEIARQKAIAEQQRRERERQQQIAAEKERQRQLAEQQEERERRARELAERERERERESEKSSGYASGASIALGMLGALAKVIRGTYRVRELVVALARRERGHRLATRRRKKARMLLTECRAKTRHQVNFAQDWKVTLSRNGCLHSARRIRRSRQAAAPRLAEPPEMPNRAPKMLIKA